MNGSMQIQKKLRPYSRTECRVYPVSLESGFLLSVNMSEREPIGAFTTVPDWDDLGF